MTIKKVFNKKNFTDNAGSNKVSSFKTDLGVDNGWVVDTYWALSDAQEINIFNANLTVPQPPKDKENQVIFLFTGLQDQKGSFLNNHILQPVLQWGKSLVGGGQYWSIASWYVGLTTISVSELLPVNPGDLITTKISGVYNDESKLYNYDCSIESKDTNRSVLHVYSIPKLQELVTALEVYGIDQCSQYPASAMTEFNNILINGKLTPDNIPWDISKSITECGQDIKIISDASNNGSIKVIYQKGR